MIGKFGKPRTRMTSDCAPVTNPTLKAKIKTAHVGHFSVTGHEKAVESLKRIFAKVKAEKPDLFAAIGTAGMLCCRLQRGSATAISNHSWGTAIDLTVNGRLDAVGDGLCQQGILDVYPYFHAEGWYWGAEFAGPREDAMHFEVAKETLATWG